jgi:hypothetical protein
MVGKYRVGKGKVQGEESRMISSGASLGECYNDDMNQILPIRQINKKFKGEWVLVENPELNKDMEVVRGKVVWHSKNRDEVYEKALELRPKRPAFLFTGKLPKDMAIIL